MYLLLQLKHPLRRDNIGLTVKQSTAIRWLRILVRRDRELQLANYRAELLITADKEREREMDRDTWKSYREWSLNIYEREIRIAKAGRGGGKRGGSGVVNLCARTADSGD